MIQQAREELLANRTEIMIAHRFVTLEQGDRIGVLEGRKLVGLGSHEQLK